MSGMALQEAMAILAKTAPEKIVAELYKQGMVMDPCVGCKAFALMPPATATRCPSCGKIWVPCPD